MIIYTVQVQWEGNIIQYDETPVKRTAGVAVAQLRAQGFTAWFEAREVKV